MQNGVIIMKNYNLPVGFGMALAQRPEAMEKFASFSDEKKQQIIDGTHSISSKQEMRQYVDKMILD